MLSAYIMPHAPIARPAVGRGEEKKIQKTLDSYRSVSRKIAQEKPETIIIISPHNVMYRDAFYLSPGYVYTDSLVMFGFPQERVSHPYDMELIDEILHPSSQFLGVSHLTRLIQHTHDKFLVVGCGNHRAIHVLLTLLSLCQTRITLVIEFPHP